MAGRQMALKSDLTRQQQIQAPIEAVGVDSGGVDAQDIIQRRRPVPPRLDRQLAARGTQPVDRQHGGDPRPGDLCGNFVQRGLAEAVQSQALPEVPAEPDIAEVPRPRPADAVEADLHHGRVRRARRGAGGKERELLLLALRIEDADGLPPAGLGRTVQLAETADGRWRGPSAVRTVSTRDQ